MRASSSGPSRPDDAAATPPAAVTPRVAIWGVGLIAAAFVAGHLPFLPQSLEDIDSINFALGLRHFDPALHQPHPPGYPLYIGLGHVSLAVIGWVAPSLGPLRVEAVALAVWSLLGGALAIVGAAMFFRAVEDAFPTERPRAPRALAVGAVTLFALTPLVSISGVRPLSDMPGLALTLVAQALIVRGMQRPTALIWGALVAGLAAGIRVQTAALTGPLLLGVLIAMRGDGAWRRRGLAVAAGAAGTLAWAVPLLLLTGGVQGYLRALGSQAGEDFAWVEMLWAQPTPRLLVLTLYRSLVLPWGDPALGFVMAALAAVGVVVAAVRSPRTLGILGLAFVPYGIFHLLLQETATIRYALPLVVPMVWLAVAAMALARRLAVLVWAAAAVSSLAVSIPTAITYGQQAHPAFRAIVDMVSEAEGSAPAAVYSHYALYRSLQAAAPPWLPVVPPERQREWLAPLQFFRQGGAQTVWFLADPVRTDMALFDPAGVETNEANPWRAYVYPEMGGARPTGAVWQRLQPPGWMAGEGWSLTPEAGGRVRAAGTGLDHRTIEAYVRRRPDPATFYVGGFHLGTTADAPAEVTVTLDGRAVDSWIVASEAAGQPFLRFVRLPDGVPAGGGPYATLAVSARALAAGRPVPEIAIRQFDLQPDGRRPLLAFADGWYEDEYEPATGLRWRWTSPRAQLRLVSSRTVVLRIRGESPLKYVGAAPTVRVSSGGRVLATFRPDNDFTWRINVPVEALASGGGVVTIETDRTYMPGAAEGTADTRSLGLRIFECRIELQ
jgi:hypothetical protein